ncbi:hypothetical protein CYMTET_3927, partial [Cymbomonas tetramitiformis]
PSSDDIVDEAWFYPVVLVGSAGAAVGIVGVTMYAHGHLGQVLPEEKSLAVVSDDAAVHPGDGDPGSPGIVLALPDVKGEVQGLPAPPSWIPTISTHSEHSAIVTPMFVIQG